MKFIDNFASVCYTEKNAQRRYDMSSKKKVLICAFTQESNSFNPLIMPLSAFSNGNIKECRNDCDVGAVSYLVTREVECVYGIAMHARSGGIVSDESVEYFLRDTLGIIEAQKPLDGVLLVLHGATMSESHDDVCGYICESVRGAVGEHAVISTVLDLHANVTEKMAQNADYMCGYHEYPHIDRRKTGERAARVLWEHLARGRKYMARAAVPTIAPAHAYTTVKGGLKALKLKAQAMIAEGRIADFSVFQVQPWLDNPLVSSAVLVIADDPDTAREVADMLAAESFQCRQEIQGEPMMSADQVIQKALENNSEKPVVLVDSADSIGAGSTGDSADVLAALLPYADVLYAATEVRDVPAVAKAFEVGVGNTAEFVIGATMAPKLSQPVTVTAKVKSLHDGSFYMNGPMSKGAKCWSGRTAMLEVGKLLIRVSETGMGSNDVNFYRSFGVPFERFALVSVKACTSFRASYGEYVSEIYNAATAGAAGTVLRQLGFERLPRPLYPFAEITEDDIVPARVYR